MHPYLSRNLPKIPNNTRIFAWRDWLNRWWAWPPKMLAARLLRLHCVSNSSSDSVYYEPIESNEGLITVTWKMSEIVYKVHHWFKIHAFIKFVKIRMLLNTCKRFDWRKSMIVMSHTTFFLTMYQFDDAGMSANMAKDVHTIQKQTCCAKASCRSSPQHYREGLQIMQLCLISRAMTEYANGFCRVLASCTACFFMSCRGLHFQCDHACLKLFRLID